MIFHDLLDLAGPKRLVVRYQHPQPVPFADALDLLEQLVMPADQLHGAAKALLAQRANDVDGVGALQRNVEEQEIGRIAPAGLEHLVRGAESLRLEPAVRDGEHASNGWIVVRDDARARRVLVIAQGDGLVRLRRKGAASTRAHTLGKISIQFS